MIQVSQNWHKSHPGGAVAFLGMQIDRMQSQPAALNRARTLLEERLRDQYGNMTRAEIRSSPVMDAYTQYYKRYKKTYHLLLQLDSIINKNKSIPRADLLVQAMFMAELKDLLLTAGHDRDKITGEIRLEAASGDEVYTLLNGEQATCKPGDMLTADSKGVFCSIIYGQDSRTQITSETRAVLYVVYVPPGIEEDLIETHLQDLVDYVKIPFPGAETTLREIIQADETRGLPG